LPPGNSKLRPGFILGGDYYGFEELGAPVAGSAVNVAAAFLIDYPLLILHRSGERWLWYLEISMHVRILLPRCHLVF